MAGGTIVTHDGRELGIAEYEPFLVADAAGEIGYPGGPMLNLEGEVLGIVASTRAGMMFHLNDVDRFHVAR